MLLVDRTKLSSHFTVLPNRVLRDEKLSFRARGLLGYLLSMDDGWRCPVGELHKYAKEGRDAVQSAAKELVAAGYLVHDKVQSDKGTWATVTYVYDTPQESSDRDTDTPETDSPKHGKPVVRSTSASIRSTSGEVTKHEVPSKKSSAKSSISPEIIDVEVVEAEVMTPQKMADVILDKHWKEQEGKTGKKPVWNYVGVRKLVVEFMEANYSPEEIDYALSNAAAYTKNALLFALKQQSKLSRVDQKYDQDQAYLQSLMAQEINNDY